MLKNTQLTLNEWKAIKIQRCKSIILFSLAIVFLIIYHYLCVRNKQQIYLRVNQQEAIFACYLLASVRCQLSATYRTD